MTGSRDAADLTSSLLEWTSGLFPDAIVVPAPTSKPQQPAKTEAPDKKITLALSGLRSFNGDRRGDAVSRRVRLDYAFDVAFSDPLLQNQAIVDLAFALLERDDVADAACVVSTGPVLSVSFELVRSNELLRAKPVEKAKFDVKPNVPVKGVVQAEGGIPLARARLRLKTDDRLIIADENGSFAFNAAEGEAIKALVSARGKSRDVELQPDVPNIITLSMES